MTQTSDLHKTLRARAKLVTRVREFFADKDVLEVSTSLLSGFAITDPAIESFALDTQPPRYLRTSPEFSHKRLLSAGMPDIYELGPVFRVSEQGRVHNPEFTLLEWYRRDFEMSDLVAEVIEFLSSVSGDSIKTDKPVIKTYRQLFQEVLDVDIDTVSVADLENFAHQNGEAPAGEMDRDQWLDWLFSACIQPAVSHHEVLAVTHYPASQAALAMLDPADANVALRFEVFVRGLELANGFQELRDADEQSERFARDNQQRASRGQKIMPVDRHFLEALKQGLPACSGVALGFDRLLMCVLAKDHIDQVLVWPWDQA